MRPARSDNRAAVRGPGRGTVVVALALWLAGIAAALAETIGVPQADGGLAEITIEGFAGINSQIDGRDVGLQPLEITIANRAKSSRSWSVTPLMQMVQSPVAVPIARITVPPGATVKQTLYVDSGDQAGLSAYLRLDGPGISAGSFSFGVASVGGPGSMVTVGGNTKTMMPTAISKGVLAAQGRAFVDRLVRGGSLDLELAPADWRGWTSFPVLLCTEGEWLGLAPGARQALLERIALGGRVGVLVADAAAERLDRLRLPPRDASGRRRVGAGEVVTVEWDGTTLTAEIYDRFAAGCEAGMEARRFDAYGGVQWRFRFAEGQPLDSRFARLTGIFGPRALPLVPIMCFLGFLAIIAGPLNLMVFAGPGRRARLFWTTPVISLVATLLLLGLIFLRDGFGGRGARRVLALLLPGQNALAIVQEQFSRTGVLLSGVFPIAEPSWMRPVGNVALDGGFHETDDAWRSGDWFRSRADQAFVIQAVRPSRTGIEVNEGIGPPAVISSIELPLARVFVIDAEGRFWTAADVGTGQRRTLEPSTAADYDSWFAGHEADAGPVRLRALEAVRGLPGHAYAEATAAGSVAVETHPAIRWENERVLFAGPFTRTEGR